jgi:hypothetical protein
MTPATGIVQRPGEQRSAVKSTQSVQLKYMPLPLFLRTDDKPVKEWNIRASRGLRGWKIRETLICGRFQCVNLD